MCWPISLGVNQKIIREKLARKENLGPDSIRLLFQVMAEQAKGAQKRRHEFLDVE
ncbi:hypothetical protein AB3H13_27425 [Escherichia coli]